MSRRVKTVALHAGGPGDGGQLSTWADKAASYIPGEVVAAWVAISALVPQAKEPSRNALMWGLFVIFLAATAYYTDRQSREDGKPRAIGQIAITTVAFAIWVFGLGGPFASLGFYDPVVGQISLAIWTLLVAPILPIKQI